MLCHLNTKVILICCGIPVEGVLTFPSSFCISPTRNNHAILSMELHSHLQHGNNDIELTKYSTVNKCIAKCVWSISALQNVSA